MREPSIWQGVEAPPPPRTAKDAWNTAGFVSVGFTCLFLLVAVIASLGSFLWGHWWFAGVTWIIFGVGVVAIVICAVNAIFAEKRENGGRK